MKPDARECNYIDYKQLEPEKRYCHEHAVIGAKNCYLHCSEAERLRVFTIEEFDRFFDHNWPTQGQAYNRLCESVRELTELKKIARIVDADAKIKLMRALLWRWAPMFTDHAFDCAVKDTLTGPCNCGLDLNERAMFLEAIK